MKNFLTKRFTEHWNRLARGVEESLFLEGFKRHDVGFRNMVLWRT